MKRFPLALVIALLGFGSLSLLGCESQGPFEETGEEIDETIDDAEDELDDLRD